VLSITSGTEKEAVVAKQSVAIIVTDPTQTAAGRTG
jgi:hypothetical protein